MNKDERGLCATFSERGRSLLTVQTGGCGSRRRMTARVVWLVQCAKKPIQMGPVQPNRRAGLSLIFRRVCNIFNAQFHLQEIRSEMRDRNEMRGETAAQCSLLTEPSDEQKYVCAWLRVSCNKHRHVFLFLLLGL